ncbi:SET domain-containing protein [Microthyrium microscopicum]|uniref:SET domain-containing protein n=1 Tax=Microthyrium microscopicum TaxID=703497 RepID=A0A6A6UPU1_9PEZI|nr:SET domain-containing protein [Microthyrium microscopicum]
MSSVSASRLLEWFKKNGGSVHENLALTFSSEYGYLFTADKSLEKEATACVCPFSLTLSYLNCLPSPPTGIESHAESSVCSSLIGKLKPNAVGTFLLAEQRTKGAESFWFPYIDALPREEVLTTPLWFHPEDLVWLWGTNLYSKTVPSEQTAVELRRAMYKEAWQSGITVLQEKGVDATKFTWELCLWAATIFSSRSFTSNIATQNADESFPLLYPVIDIFNHRFGEKVFWNMEKGTFRLELPEGAPTGEQVFNNYAPKGNEELLMGYGFCIENNPCDQLVLRLAKPPGVVHLGLKSSMPSHFKSETWSVEESGFYVRGRNHYAGAYANQSGLECLRGVQPELVSALRIMVAFSFESSYTDPKHQQAELWWATLDALSMRLQQKRDAITQWDGMLPATPQNRRQAFAKIYRDSQLRILNEVIEELDTVLGPLDREETTIFDVFL